MTSTIDSPTGSRPAAEQEQTNGHEAVLGEYRAEVDRLSTLLDEAERRCQAHTPPSDAIGDVMAALGEYAAGNATQRYAARTVMMRVASDASLMAARMHLVDAAIMVWDEYPAATRLLVHLDANGDDDPVLYRVYDQADRVLWDGYDGAHMPDQRDLTIARAVENAWNVKRTVPEIRRIHGRGGTFGVDLPDIPNRRP